jgi:hypothetical protein
MNAIANLNSASDSSEKTQSSWKSNLQARANSKKIESILLNWPQTVNYINKKWILVTDDDMILIFWKVADRRNRCFIRNDSEMRPQINVTSKIVDWLNEDIRKWWRNSIHHIKANPETIKCLFLEWTLTHEVISSAYVNDWVVILSKVCFNTIEWTLSLPIMCSPEFEFDYATIGNNWKMIE